MKYRLVVIDLDNTLVAKPFVISKINQAAIQNLLENNVYVLIATGRSMENILPITDQLHLAKQKPYAPVVGFNGSCIYDLKTAKMLHKVVIEQKDVAQIIRWSEELHLQFFAYSADDDKKAYITKQKGAITWWMKRHTPQREHIILAENEPCTFNAWKVSVAGDQAQVALFLKRVQEAHMKLNCFDFHVGFLRWTKQRYLDITHQEADKLTGIKKVAQLLNIKQSEVIAIGDGQNDVAMVKWAATGVAMKNSHPDLIKVADYVTLPCKQSGVGFILHKIMHEQIH